MLWPSERAQWLPLRSTAFMMRWNAKSLSERSISPTPEAIQIIQLKGKPIQKLIKNSQGQLKCWTDCFSTYDRMLTGRQPNDDAGSLYATPACWAIHALWVQRSKFVGEFGVGNFTVAKDQWRVLNSCCCFSTKGLKRKVMLHSGLVSQLHSAIYENL